MKFQLRPYQRQAVEATLRHFRSTSAPACVVLPTGAGKSIVIAELARLAKGRVLVLAHVKELCQQNHAKYESLTRATAYQSAGLYSAAVEAGAVEAAGIYSAGLGQKDARCAVTFASVQSVARNLVDFATSFSLLIIDECHRVSGAAESQYGQVLEKLRQGNRTLKVLGLTATPYRLESGWIYRFHHRGMVRTEERRPFDTCIFEISLREMIEQGYLTPPRVEDAPIAQYDFSSLDSNRGGPFPEVAVNALLVRHRRVTEAIIEQIVGLASARQRRGVMIFAATVDHAREIAGLLPVEESALILGETENLERDENVCAFREQRLRYLVNVSVLTTGFDVPHVDLIAILRPTQSVSLFQQIVGRGLRLFPGKEECLVIDYAGNGFDLFSPEVGERKPAADSVVVQVVCPLCEFENQFWGKEDSEGHVVEHFGRRCQRFTQGDMGRRQRCEYRFRFKECPQCCAENDIAARRCQKCEATLVDPDDQLKQALSLADALVLRVAAMSFAREGTRLKITYHDEDGTSTSERYDFSHPGQLAVFNRVFSRRLASGRRPLVLTDIEQALRLQALFPVPDFVVARKRKTKGGRKADYRVQERVFDYQGRYRKAFPT